MKYELNQYFFYKRAPSVLFPLDIKLFYWGILLLSTGPKRDCHLQVV
jgi:hypothetical protein